MDKKKARELLKQALNEIPRLKGLHCKNPEFYPWDQRVKEILRETFGNNSNEYARYNGIILLKRVHTEEDKQRAYIDCLNQREVALKSIIQKHEILGAEEKPVTNDKKSIYQKIWLWIDTHRVLSILGAIAAIATIVGVIIGLT